MGNRCGTGEFSGKTKLWYPRIAQDVYEQSSALSGNPLEVYLYGLCVASCPVPQARRTTSITDYGYGHTSDAKERSWSVDMATSSSESPRDARTHARAAPPVVPHARRPLASRTTGHRPPPSLQSL
eukprot:5029004-Prymnesium_polylepis.1